MGKFLKYLLTISISGMFSMVAKADDNESVNTMLFAQFEEGYAILKSNKAQVYAKFNYDKIAEKVVFMEDGTAFELNANSVTVVVIKERFFFPEGNNFYYERITTGDNEYFVRHKVKLLSKGKSAGYGTYSESSAIMSMSSANIDGQTHKLETNENFERKDDSGVLILNGRKYARIVSLKSLVNLFKSHQPALESYAKEHKTDFAKVENVIAIVEYAFSL